MPRRLRQTLLDRRPVLEEMVKFAIAGLGATVIFLITFNCVGIFSDLAWWQALIVANVPAVAVAYVISAEFVFANNNEYKRHTEITLFFMMTAIAIAIGASALGLVESLAGHKVTAITANVVTAIATIASWGLRFLLSRRVIFKSHLERPPVDIATEIAHVAEELDEKALERPA